MQNLVKYQVDKSVGWITSSRPGPCMHSQMYCGTKTDFPHPASPVTYDTLWPYTKKKKRASETKKSSLGKHKKNQEKI